MALGISTASLYPQLTEEALAFLGQSGIKTTEIFLNSESETYPAFVKQLEALRQQYGITVTAVHPFASFAEPYDLFSAYTRRFADGQERFRKFFNAAATLGAKYVVLHGDRITGELPAEVYCHRYKILYDLGQSFGVTLTQENVNNYRASGPAFIEKMRQQLGNDAKFTLDVKQCIRSGHTVDEIARAMGQNIVHIHISDHTPKHDCLLPGKGQFDFGDFFAKMQAGGYAGDYMIEVYRAAYQQPSELIAAYNALKADNF